MVIKMQKGKNKDKDNKKNINKNNKGNKSIDKKIIVKEEYGR